MASEKSRSKLLEVSVVERGTSSWEWRVYFGAEALISGFDSTHTGAKDLPDITPCFRYSHPDQKLGRMIPKAP